jgi:hypothetical protein
LELEEFKVKRPGRDLRVATNDSSIIISISFELIGTDLMQKWNPTLSCLEAVQAKYKHLLVKGSCLQLDFNKAEDNTEDSCQVRDI